MKHVPPHCDNPNQKWVIFYRVTTIWTAVVATLSAILLIKGLG